MSLLKQYFGYRTIKTAIGAAIAIFVSQVLGIDYAANTGIIAILSVQSTKKKSRDLAIMRIFSTVLALSIGWAVFSLFGFTAIAFGLYLLLFIPLAAKLKFHDGIVPCSVLVTHLLSIESVSLGALGNEMLQMLIGSSIGFVLNLHIPSLEKKLLEEFVHIDLLMQKILLAMASCLRTQSSDIHEDLYTELEAVIQENHTRALKEHENRLIRGNYAYVTMMEVRMAQFEALLHMKRLFKRLDSQYEQTLILAEFTEEIANGFGTGSIDKVNELGKEYHLPDEDHRLEHHYMETIELYRRMFQNMPLPQTQDEFEHRATLFVFLNDIEHFIGQRSFTLE
jgi:uncharacterized membrane protein YgaE (UPF0421/DUF939 family)